MMCHWKTSLLSSSNSLRNHSHVMVRSGRGGPDSDTGTLVSRSLNFLIQAHGISWGHRRLYMHSNTHRGSGD